MIAGRGVRVHVGVGVHIGEGVHVGTAVRVGEGERVRVVVADGVAVGTDMSVSVGSNVCVPVRVGEGSSGVRIGATTSVEGAACPTTVTVCIGLASAGGDAVLRQATASAPASSAAAMPSLALDNDPYLMWLPKVPRHVYHRQAQLVHAGWEARSIPCLEEPIHHGLAMGIADAMPPGGLLAQAILDLVELKLGDIRRPDHLDSSRDSGVRRR